MLVGGLVGGYGARAVSRKTPIYFMFCNMKKQGLDDGGTMQLKIDFDFVVGMFLF